MKLKAQDILPTHEQLPDDLYRRLVYYVDNYCLRHDLLYQYGWGHLLLACYAAFPAHLSPDLLHKIRLNFRHYQQILPLQEDDPKAPEEDKQEKITREIPLVAVSDLLLSNLLRETGFERFEMPEALRHYLLWLYQHSGILEEKCAIFPIPPSSDSPELSPETARLNGLAEFLKYYANEHYTAADPITSSLREAQKWTAEAWQNPEKAASFLRERLSSATKPTELYHFSRLGKRLGVQYDLQLNARAENAPDSFEPLRTYARGVSSLYEGKVKQAIETLGGADQLIATELNAAPAPGAVRLPVPREVAKELLKQRPELLEKPLGLKPREWASLEERLRSPWPKAVLTIDDGDRVEIAQRLVRLEQSLRERYQDTSLRLADFFDVISGSGVGAVMAAMAVSVNNAEDILSLLRLQEGSENAPQYITFLREYCEDQRFPNETFRNGLLIALESTFNTDMILTNNLSNPAGESSVLLFDLLSGAISEAVHGSALHSAYDTPTHSLNLATINVLLDQEATFNWKISPEQFLFVSIQADLPPALPIEKIDDDFRLASRGLVVRQPENEGKAVNAMHQTRQQARWIERHHLDLLNKHRMQVVNWGAEGEVDWPEAWRVEKPSTTSTSYPVQFPKDTASGDTVSPHSALAKPLAEFRRELKDLVAINETSRAFEVLIAALSSDSKFYNELVLIQAELNTLNRDRTSGAISMEEYSKRNKKLLYTFLEFVDGLSESDFEVSVVSNRPKGFSKPLPEFRRELKDLVAINETSRAFEVLIAALSSDSKFYNDLVLIQAELNALNRDRTSGAISMEEYSKRNKKLLYTFLEFVDGLSESDFEVSVVSNRPKGFSKPLPEFRRELKDLVAINEISRAFEVLIAALSSDSKFYNDMVLIQFTLNALNRDRTSGTISIEEYSKRNKELLYTFLRFVDGLSESDFEISAKPSEQKQNTKQGV